VHVEAEFGGSIFYTQNAKRCSTPFTSHYLLQRENNFRVIIIINIIITITR